MVRWAIRCCTSVTTKNRTGNDALHHLLRSPTKLSLGRPIKSLMLCIATLAALCALSYDGWSSKQMNLCTIHLTSASWLPWNLLIIVARYVYRTRQTEWCFASFPLLWSFLLFYCEVIKCGASHKPLHVFWCCILLDGMHYGFYFKYLITFDWNNLASSAIS